MHVKVDKRHEGVYVIAYIMLDWTECTESRENKSHLSLMAAELTNGYITLQHLTLIDKR